MALLPVRRHHQRKLPGCEAIDDRVIFWLAVVCEEVPVLLSVQKGDVLRDKVRAGSGGGQEAVLIVSKDATGVEGGPVVNTKVLFR